MEEVDASVAWRQMRRLPRKLFTALGALRDIQVLEDLVKRLLPADEALRATLVHKLHQRQGRPLSRARRLARKFDDDRWKRLGRTLSARLRLVPANGVTAKALALERHEALRRLHARALRTDSAEGWHAVRVALKRFRYAVDWLLPERSEVWDESLGQVQTLLGAIHDLDVLQAWMADESSGLSEESVNSLRHAIETERSRYIQQYRARMTGSSSLLHVWKAGLPDTRVAARARLHAIAHAMDPHPRRSADIARLALQLFDELATCGADRRFRQNKNRIILQAAAHLHAIRVVGLGKPRHKAARDILRGMPVPPGWRPADWELVSLVVRYHRGAEPALRHRAFALLSGGAQKRVRGVAGLLRLAHGLNRCGVTAGHRVSIDEMAGCVRVHVIGLQHTLDNAARIAVAKHLLEVFLRRPIVVSFAGLAWQGRSAGAPRRLESDVRNATKAGSTVRDFSSHEEKIPRTLSA
jgi:CHAD domain-containing protein